MAAGPAYHVVAADNTASDETIIYGVEPDGAVLVRPDGQVGWRNRSAVADPGAELERALQGIRGHVPVRAG